MVTDVVTYIKILSCTNPKSVLIIGGGSQILMAASENLPVPRQCLWRLHSLLSALSPCCRGICLILLAAVPLSFRLTTALLNDHPLSSFLPTKRRTSESEMTQAYINVKTSWGNEKFSEQQLKFMPLCIVQIAVRASCN